MIQLNSYIARNGLDLPGVVVLLSNLQLNAGTVISASLEPQEESLYSLAESPSSNINFSFKVYRDLDAIKQGFTPIEDLKIDNPNYQVDPNHPGDPLIGYFSLTSPVMLTFEEACQKAYEYILDTGKLDGELI